MTGDDAHQSDWLCKNCGFRRSVLGPEGWRLRWAHAPEDGNGCLRIG